MATSIVEKRGDGGPFDLSPWLSAEQVVKDYVEYKAPRRRGSLATANWVTTLAHPCTAYAVYMRTVPPENRRMLKDSLGMIFSEGNDQARAIKRDLIDMGYEVEGAEGQLAWPKYQITGREDHKIRKIGQGAGVDTEVKSCSPFSYDSINSVDDLKNHKWDFMKKWYRQVALYMVLKSVNRYWLLLKNKSTGQIKIIEFHLGDEELATAEAMIKRAETANKLVQIGQLPTTDMKLSDVDTCSECEFIDTCLPEIDFGPGALILTDERALEMATKLERRAELEPSAKEFKELDDELKEETKAICSDGQPSMVVGDWVANLKTIDKKAYTVKAQKQTSVKFVKVGKEK